MKAKRTFLPLLGILLFLAGISAFLYFFNPKEIVEWIGVKNSYLVIFLMAAIGGLSSFTGLSFFAAIATFASGGASPWLLGLAGGAGLFISDTVFFFLARYGKKSIPERWEQRLDRYVRWSQGLPFWIVFAIVAAYIGLSPLPNDILMLALAVAGFSYPKIAPAILLGSVSIATISAHLGKAGISFFQ